MFFNQKAANQTGLRIQSNRITPAAGPRIHSYHHLVENSLKMSLCSSSAHVSLNPIAHVYFLQRDASRALGMWLCVFAAFHAAAYTSITPMHRYTFPTGSFHTSALCYLLHTMELGSSPGHNGPLPSHTSKTSFLLQHEVTPPQATHPQMHWRPAQRPETVSTPPCSATTPMHYIAGTRRQLSQHDITPPQATPA